MTEPEATPLSVPAASVRYFRGWNGIYAMTSEYTGKYFGVLGKKVSESMSTLGTLIRVRDEISPDAALAELANWPEAQRDASRVVAPTPAGEANMTEQAKCQLCGEPMPPGEEMFNYHGYSGPCPSPPQQPPPAAPAKRLFVLPCERSS